MGEIPALTTPAEAYELAKRAQRRGSTWMQVTCSAEGRRFARQVTRPWRDQRHLICPGFVTRRWFDSDEIVQALTVTVDVVDVLVGFRNMTITQFDLPAPVRKRRRQLSVVLAR